MPIHMKRRDPFAGVTLVFDTETTGLRAWTGDRPFAFAFGTLEGDTDYVEFPVDPKTRRVMYEKRPAELARLRRLLGDPRTMKIAWNAKFDVQMCEMAGIPVAGPVRDGMHALHCCFSSEPTYALKPAAEKFVQYSQEDLQALQAAIVKLRRKAKALGWSIGEDVEQDYWLVQYAARLLDDPDEAAILQRLCEQYAVGDVERTILMWHYCQHAMDQLGTRPVFDDESALWPVVYAMERLGVRVDPVELQRTYDAYRAEYDSYLKLIQEVGRAAKVAGDLDIVMEGDVVAIDRLKSGVTRRVRIAAENGKVRWFNARGDVAFEPGVETLDVGDRVSVREPFNQDEFNPDSDEQLGRVLYDHLKLTASFNAYAAKKRKNEYTRATDVTTLMEMSGSHDFPEWILKWRSVGKVLQFYDKYRLYSVKNGNYWVLNPEFTQCGPKTGRFSARHPNIQQTPSRNTGRSPFPVDGRAPFGPRPWHRWYCIDYSQLEVRIFAALSGERKMLEIIRSGRHIHKACADHVWGFRDGQPTKAAVDAAVKAMGYAVAGDSGDSLERSELRRRFGKASPEDAALRWLTEHGGSIVAAEATLHQKNSINKAKLMIFTRIFGGGIPSIMNLLRCSREEAITFLDEYGEAFPDMDPWIKRVTREAAQEGCVWTAFGRRIDIPDKDKAYRAVNNKVQGSAADLLKRAMRNTHTYLQEERVAAALLLSIHDELIFEFDLRKPHRHHVVRLREIMEDHGGVFSLPMVAEIEMVTRRWCDKEKLTW